MTPKAFNKAMGAVITDLRKAHDLSLYEVGKALGVTYQHAHKYSTGENGLAAYNVPKLAKIFGLTVADLYQRAGVQLTAHEPTPADDDAFLISRNIRRILDANVRQAFIDVTYKLAYPKAKA